MHKPTSWMTALSWRENGKIFTQQVKKYLRALGVKDAALFDWNHLVILDMSYLDADQRDPNLVRYTWFEENGDVRNYKHNDAQFSSPSNEPMPHDWLKLISFFYCFYSLITPID